MKKLTILFSLFLFITACGKEEISPGQPILKPDEGVTVSYRPEISLKRAKDIAENAPSMFEDGITKGATKKILNSEVISSGALTKSSGIDTLMYVFNYAEGGYVVIPSLDTKGEILAYIEEGSFHIGDTTHNDLQRYLVQLMINNQLKTKAEYANSKNTTKGIITPPSEESIPVGPMCSQIPTLDDYGDPVPAPSLANSMGVDYYIKYGCAKPYNKTTYTLNNMRQPLLTTCWDQGWPYNSKAPLINGRNALAGCVAVAAAQIMTYFNYPTQYPTFTASEIAEFSGKATNLARLNDYKYITGSSPSGPQNAVSTLLRVLGRLLNNNWGASVTTASTYNILDAFLKMGYEIDVYLYTYNTASVSKSLYYYKPVYISGMSPNAAIGHAWVIDGEKMILWKSIRYTDYFDANGNYNGRSENNSTHEQSFFHCNFGWGGSSNGYYEDGIFDTSNPFESTGPQINNGVYCENLKILPNIIIKQ